MGGLLDKQENIGRLKDRRVEVMNDGNSAIEKRDTIS